MRERERERERGREGQRGYRGGEGEQEEEEEAEDVGGGADRRGRACASWCKHARGGEGGWDGN